MNRYCDCRNKHSGSLLYTAIINRYRDTHTYLMISGESSVLGGDKK